MASTLINVMRLASAGLVMAQHGVRFVPAKMKVPLALRLAQWAVYPITLLTWPLRANRPRDQRISDALARLGPSYIKLGQFMATRADVIGPKLAGELSSLQDKLPAFSDRESRRAIEESLLQPRETLFDDFGPPVAAASIAQVHKAKVAQGGGVSDVAVKVLRPGVERRFRADLDSYFFAARQIERWHPPARRLRPVAVVETLRRTTELEMDLRLEAAAISEMAENIKGDEGFRVPSVDWAR
ncbi:MAG: AarF/UbiB family protein, partial [Pseudomonadota bacterium]